MKIQIKHINYSKIAFFALLLIFPITIEAQRFGHGASMSRPHTASRPSAGRQPINGGFHKQPSRNIPSTRPATRPSRPTTTSRPSTRPSTGNSSRSTVNRPNNNNSRPNHNGNLSNSNVVNRPHNNNNNNVNINVNRNNNVHINNRHTVVRPNPRPYYRPPYSYGGFHYYAYHPYYYHPFTPFYWGPIWHPWGFFVASLATTAIIISVENEQYHYDQGNYYVKEKDGYTVVQAPVGATIKVLPDGYETVSTGDSTNNYYYGGAYYEKDSDGYTVVPPTAGTVAENLPEGAEEVRIGDQTYVKYGETYYQPVKIDGKNQYEVAEVKEE